MEFFLYAGVFLFVLLAVFSMATLLQTTEIPAREALAAREQGETMAEALRLAALAGEGFQYNLTFPKKLLGRPYTIDLDDDQRIFVLTWNSSVGQANYIYTLPGYRYRWEGCMADRQLISTECRNVLELWNTGEELVVRQD